jgi:hypothetical protein
MVICYSLIEKNADMHLRPVNSLLHLYPDRSANWCFPNQRAIIGKCGIQPLHYFGRHGGGPPNSEISAGDQRFGSFRQQSRRR